MNVPAFDPVAAVPLATATLPGIGGRIKVQPDDFEVEEVPAYEPSGSGTFLFLWVEKRSMGAEYFVRQIARRLNIPTENVGTAGNKDRQAVTRQMVSVPEEAEPRLGQLDGDGIRLLRVSRHGNKLRPGHLHGNRFRVLVREVVAGAEQHLPALLEHIRQQGMINFYGSQRFGREGETVRLGLELLAGQRKRRVTSFLRRLSLSAVQSALFNHYLARRLADELVRRVLPGDVMARWPFGGLFRAEDVEREQQRLDSREIVPTGPMFGRKMFAAHDEAGQREAETLQAAGLTEQSFHGFGKLLGGTRRHILIYVDDLAAAIEPEGVRLTFTLPAGAYATILLQELMHSAALEGSEES
jgi:tRNA pseudouridine13 synthase